MSEDQLDSDIPSFKIKQSTNKSAISKDNEENTNIDNRNRKRHLGPSSDQFKAEDSKEEPYIIEPPKKLSANSLKISQRQHSSVSTALRPVVSSSSLVEETKHTFTSEGFAKALLRGLGWKDGTTIGRNPISSESLQVKSFAKLAGLGSVNKGLPVPMDQSSVSNDFKEVKNSLDKFLSESSESSFSNRQSKDLQIDSVVIVTDGPYEGLYGRVLSIFNDKVQLRLSNQALGNKVNIEDCKLLDLRKLDPSHPARLFAKQEEYLPLKSMENQKVKFESTQKKTSLKIEDVKILKSSTQIVENYKNSVGICGHSDSKPSRSQPFHQKEHRSIEWAHSDIRVRYIGQGKYHLQKGVIVDIPSLISMRMDSDGKIIDNISEEDLETYIPSRPGDLVMFVRGKHKGKVGSFLGKDKSGLYCQVQLGMTSMNSVELDDVSMFLGESEKALLSYSE